MSADGNAKYKSASAIASYVLQSVVGIVAPGMSVAAICSYSDALVSAHCKSVYRKEQGIERGISFPTTVSVNKVIQNYSPSSEDDYIMREGDVVKVEIGVHIDGYISSAAHTTVATNSPGVVITDRRADAISAAYYASEVAVRMIRPGQTPRNLIKAIGLVASGFKCSVAEETFTCQIDRFVVSGNNTFANRFNPDVVVPETPFETGEVYTIDCTISTGDGQARASQYNPSIYQRDVNQHYSLKLRTSRTLFSEVCKRFSVFPFLMREAIADNHTLKAGIGECVKSRLLVPFAVTTEKLTGDQYVAQFKVTVMCNYTGPIRLTRALPMPSVQSGTTIPADSEIGQILGLDFEQAALPELPRLKLNIQTPVPVIDQSVPESSSMDTS
ncbi:hypothetical protein GGI15_002080 [Coemansia interrupta]|uniref:Peptidase M24 domain-containing protein n=1 Tax=Coemansia interrupta TaxID=1126814 RepID=A0A9W8LMB1_9FUNG|nr:hypothetical protein GGI15_002080 [Coemansia interrupta]